MEMKAMIRHVTPTACSKLLFTVTYLLMLKNNPTIIDVA